MVCKIKVDSIKRFLFRSKIHCELYCKSQKEMFAMPKIGSLLSLEYTSNLNLELENSCPYKRANLCYFAHRLSWVEQIDDFKFRQG